MWWRPAWGRCKLQFPAAQYVDLDISYIIAQNQDPNKKGIASLQPQRHGLFDFVEITREPMKNRLGCVSKESSP